MWRVSIVECEESELGPVEMKSTQFLMSQRPAWCWSQIMNKEFGNYLHGISATVSTHKFLVSMCYAKHLNRVVIVEIS